MTAHSDPFSDTSGWLTPEWIRELLRDGRGSPPGTELLRSTGAAESQAELMVRVQLHVAEKALLLQQRIATDQEHLQERIAQQSDAAARSLTRTTRWLAVATFGLVVATIVLVVVTALHH